MRGPKAITFISLLLLLGALLPAAAHASVIGNIFSIFSGTAQAKSDDTGTATSDSADNLQTLDLPTPPKNSDPNSPQGSGDITIVNGTALLPEEGPSGTMADIEKPKNSTISLYVVRDGDTVHSVADMFGVSDGTILSANDLARGASLHTGEQLIILPVPEVKYTVKKGDTLESIASRYGGDATEIALQNGIDNSTLVVGQHIYIPNGEIPATSELASKPTTPKKNISTTAKPSGKLIPLANNPAEPAHNVGAPGTSAQIAYYVSPLSHYIQTQGIHGYNAVDLAAPTGTAIRASAAGTVTIAKQGGWNGGYGSYVVISHANGSQTLYGHMSSVVAQSGAHVAQGELIGYVGETGEATGPHLHFEIRNGIRNPF